MSAVGKQSLMLMHQTVCSLICPTSAGKSLVVQPQVWAVLGRVGDGHQSQFALALVNPEHSGFPGRRPQFPPTGKKLEALARSSGC